MPSGDKHHNQPIFSLLYIGLRVLQSKRKEPHPELGKPETIATKSETEAGIVFVLFCFLNEQEMFYKWIGPKGSWSI